MMRRVRIMFTATTAIQVLVSLLGDRDTYRRGALRRSWRQFRRSPAMRRETWQRLKEYERPGFHPNDRDTSDLVATWRAELFGDDGSMTHLLASSAA